MSAAASASPFAALLGTQPWRLPKSGAVSIVINGERVSNARQIKALFLADADPDDPDELQAAAALAAKHIAELRRAKDAARYQRRKQDPEFQAKRKAYAERTRKERAAWKKKYDRKTIKKQRKQKAAWARRAYLADPDKQRAAQRKYYAANRERILAKLKAQREADKLAAGSQP